MRTLLLFCFFVTPLAAAEPLYRESLRPQFHFTAAKDYLNDPNGLFFLDGTYHLFFQTGPITAKRWGHATSTDLLHWKQLDDALVPVKGFPAFSGCAVIDTNNTSGFKTGEHPPVVAVFTSWGEGQCLAVSNDRGATWKRFEGNPVLKLPHDAKKSFPLSARDPHVMWDEPRKRWVMVLYDNVNAEVKKGAANDRQGGFSIFTSPNLKEWTKRSHLPGFYVCPDVFKLPIEDEKAKAWIAMDWTHYAVGEFDGETFTPRMDRTLLDVGANLSANQTWKNLPDGRVVQIAWIRGGKYPGMPFDQQMSVPMELSLRRIGKELRLCKQPIRELKTLHEPTEYWADGTCPTRSFDLSFQAKLNDGDAVEVNVLGQVLTLKPYAVEMMGKTAKLSEPLSDVRILADVTSVEIFVNRGATAMTFTVLPSDDKPVTWKAIGTPKLTDGSLRTMKSIWK
jgi:fructan beta-fructosidase